MQINAAKRSSQSAKKKKKRGLSGTSPVTAWSQSQTVTHDGRQLNVELIRRGAALLIFPVSVALRVGKDNKQGHRSTKAIWCLMAPFKDGGD